MEFTVHKDELARALHLCQSVADKRTSMPILSHVLIEAKGGSEGMSFTATDMEVGVRVGVSGTVDAHGAIALPAKHLNDIVRQLPSDDISVKELDNERVQISAGPLEYKIPGLPADQFPAVPLVEEAATIDLEEDQLKDMLTKTAFAASTDETRYNLNGIYVEVLGEGEHLLRLVATDGHRLALVEGGDASSRPETLPEKGVIVPRKGVAEMRRILDAALPGSDGGKQGCSLGFRENHGLFRRGGVTLVMRLIDGQFPDYRQVVPADSDKSLELDRDLLLKALRQVSVLAVDQSAHATRFSIEAGNVEISNTGQDGSEARTSLPVQFDGDGFVIGFNAKYVIDVLEVCSDGGMTLSMSDDVSPAILQPTARPEYRCVIMPMRT